MDEILDYLLWKHKRTIEQGLCVILGFALGSAYSMFTEPDRDIVRIVCTLLFIVLTMFIIMRNDKPRTYTLPDDESTPGSLR
jgi:hypothetical protein